MDYELLKQKYESLSAEYLKGVEMLKDYKEKVTDLEESLTRIEGAKDILQELMDECNHNDETGKKDQNQQE